MFRGVPGNYKMFNKLSIIIYYSRNHYNLLGLFKCKNKIHHLKVSCPLVEHKQTHNLERCFVLPFFFNVPCAFYLFIYFNWMVLVSVFDVSATVSSTPACWDTQSCTKHATQTLAC